MKNLKKPHRAWVIMAGALMIQAGMLGILVNCTGILFSEIIADLHMRAGDLSVYYTIRSLTCAAAVGVTTKIFFKYNEKYVMAFLGTLFSVSFGLMYFFTDLWQWYVSAFFSGIGMSCTMVVIPIVLNNWFYSNNGLVVGCTMSASGVTGALFSPVCSKLISAFGWRTASAIMAFLAFCLIVTASLLILVVSPEKAGCTPYRKEGERKKAAEDIRSKGEKEVPTGIFIMSLVAVIGVSSLTQFNNQIPTFSQSIGNAINVGTVMTSLAMIGNVLGKLSVGALADRIGIYRAIQLIMCCVAGSMILFLFGSSSVAALNAASFAYGLVYALMATAPALLYLNMYGDAAYKQKVSQMQAINGVISAFLSSVFPYIYDFTGSFKPVFVFGVGICFVSCILLEKIKIFLCGSSPGVLQRKKKCQV